MQASPGPRQIVICCDGTNNTLTGRQRDTNVLRLFEHLARHADADQLLYYDPGVGSVDALPPTDPVDWLRRKWERASALASGRGAFENMGEAYAFLIQHWRPGTQIWIFGFSRGAFTARSISGLVNLFGMVKPEYESMLPTLMRVYFSPRADEVPVEEQRKWQKMAETFAGLEMEANVARTREQIAQQVRDSFTTPEGRDTGVHFVGVWDTVEAIGLPGLALRITSRSTISGTRIAHARHALSLDEHRATFSPRMYGEDNFGTPADTQSLKQLWFRGVHGDAGGGYAPGESALSDAALAWMVEEAIACGLRCPPLAPPQAQPLIHDPVYTVPWWTAAGLGVRDSAPEADDGRRLTPVAHPSVQALAPALRSVWNEPRAIAPWLLAFGGALLFAMLHGMLLLGHRSAIDEALHAGAQMAAAQLRLLWTVPFGDWRTLWALTPHDRWLWAFVADFALILSYAYVFGRLLSRAYTRRAGLRTVGEPVPSWRVLGRALPLAIGGDVVENIATMLALAWPGWSEPIWLWVASVGALAKWIGLAGCALLLAIGWLPKKR